MQTSGRRLTQASTTVAYSNLASGSYQFNVQPSGSSSADSIATTVFSVAVSGLHAPESLETAPLERTDDGFLKRISRVSRP